MQVNNLPLVSIIITSYNRSEYIEETLKSALAQDYLNLEIIISDNCSTDNTDNIIKKYTKDKRIKYFVNEKNIGMIPNFKLATERAMGQFITYISSDDYLIDSQFVSKCISLVNKYENILLVFSKMKVLYEDGKILEKSHYADLYTTEFKDGKTVFLEFANSFSLGWGGTFINRNELRALNIFEAEGTSLDFEVNLIMMLRGNVGFINEFTYVLRNHNSQASAVKNAEKCIKNYSYFLRPYKYAMENKLVDLKQLDRWKSKIFLNELRYTSIAFLPNRQTEYNKLISWYKINEPEAYKTLLKDVKWHILHFFFKRPYISLFFFKIISKPDYYYLKKLLNKE